MNSNLANSHIQAKNFTNTNGRKVDLIVIHTAEVAEMGDSAENVARFFANQPAGNSGSSAHYCTDNNTIVSCVDELDVAWAAPGANHNGVQIEISGRAAQTGSQWNDEFSEATLTLTAKLAADIAKRHSIPIRHLTNDQLRAGARGFIGHVQASQVFKRSTHTDPGSSFPWGEFIAETKAFAAGEKRVRYQLMNGDGGTIGSPSTWFKPGTNETTVYVGWVTRNAAKHVRELRADGDIGVRRQKQ